MADRMTDRMTGRIAVRMPCCYSEPMTSDSNMTPAELTALLQVSDRTVRRIAEAYEEVYGKLPESSRKTRLFPPVAVQRMTSAYATLRSAPGLSAKEVFSAQRDGQTVRTRDRITPDVLAPVMAELHAIRSEIAALRELVEKYAPVSHDNTPPALPADLDTTLPSDDAPAPSDSGVQQMLTAMYDSLAISNIQAASEPESASETMPKSNQDKLMQQLVDGYRLRETHNGRVELVSPDGNTQMADRRTVNALVKKHLLEPVMDSSYGSYALTAKRLLPTDQQSDVGEGD